MSTIERLACRLHRKDEVPNQELARDLALKRDRKGIQEIAENLWNRDRAVANDCIKVLYEIGYIEPRLISQFAEDFVRLLGGPNNRMVWGAMLALSTVASLCSDALFPYCDQIQSAIENGSVITQDNGIITLAIVASKSDRYRKRIVPFLLKHLATCRPKDVPQRAEKSLIAINAEGKSEFIKILNKRANELTPPQKKRFAKVISRAEEL